MSTFDSRSFVHQPSNDQAVLITPGDNHPIVNTNGDRRFAPSGNLPSGNPPTGNTPSTPQGQLYYTTSCDVIIDPQPVRADDSGSVELKIREEEVVTTAGFRPKTESVPTANEGCVNDDSDLGSRFYPSDSLIDSSDPLKVIRIKDVTTEKKINPETKAN